IGWRCVLGPGSVGRRRGGRGASPRPPVPGAGRPKGPRGRGPPGPLPRRGPPPPPPTKKTRRGAGGPPATRPRRPARRAAGPPARGGPAAARPPARRRWPLGDRAARQTGGRRDGILRRRAAERPPEPRRDPVRKVASHVCEDGREELVLGNVLLEDATHEAG